MRMSFYSFMFFLFSVSSLFAQNFSVTNVRVEQRGDGSFYVDIFYNLSLVTATATISMQASSDNGNTWGLSCNSVTGAIGAGITAGNNKQIVWNFGAEHVNFYSEQIKVKIIADDGITPCPGTPTVTYEGKTYNTVQIGSQCWLKENLNVGVYVPSVNTGSTHSDVSNNGIIEKYCYNNDTTNCNIYGGLYDWNEAMQYVTTAGAQGICPLGWHIPTHSELVTLSNFVGENGNSLKSVGQGTGIGSGSNSSGFSGLLAGIRQSEGYFHNLSENQMIWTSTMYNAYIPYSLNLWLQDAGIYFPEVFSKTFGFSIRCCKDIKILELNTPNGGENWQAGTSQNITWTSSYVTNVKLEYTTNNGTNWTTITSNTPAASGSYSWSVPNTPTTNGKVRILDATNASVGDTSNAVFTLSINCPSTVTYAGKTYNTVVIGTQCWLKENLNVGTRINGSQDQTNSGTIEKYCYNDQESNCDIYGGLYQWNEAMQYVDTAGTQGICPPGWHIPRKTELETLRNAVGGNSNALKAVGQGTGSGAGTNTSGFSALLAGNRWEWGSYGWLGGYGYFWLSTQSNQPYADYLLLSGSDTDISISGDFKFPGFSVRCLKN